MSATPSAHILSTARAVTDQARSHSVIVSFGFAANACVSHMLDTRSDALEVLRREAEANAYLSLTLTLASLLLLFVARKLAVTLSEREQMKVSQSAMLRCRGALTTLAHALLVCCATAR